VYPWGQTRLHFGKNSRTILTISPVENLLGLGHIGIPVVFGSCDCHIVLCLLTAVQLQKEVNGLRLTVMDTELTYTASSSPGNVRGRCGSTLRNDLRAAFSAQRSRLNGWMARRLYNLQSFPAQFSEARTTEGADCNSHRSRGWTAVYRFETATLSHKVGPKNLIYAPAQQKGTTIVRRICH
jgi:hypothetical protein